MGQGTGVLQLEIGCSGKAPLRRCYLSKELKEMGEGTLQTEKPMKEHAVHVQGIATGPWCLEWSHLGKEGHGGWELGGGHQKS